MYESAFLEHRLDKASYKAEEPKLRAELLEAQLDLVEGRKFSVLILVTGMDGAGKGELIQRLYEWLDPRHVRTNGYGEPDEGERQRPWMWRYWRDLPPRGEVGVVFGSWYNDPIRAHGGGRHRRGRLRRASLEAIARFEQMLADEGTLHPQVHAASCPRRSRRSGSRRCEATGAPAGTCSRSGPRFARQRQEGRERNRDVVETVLRDTRPAARALDRAAERRSGYRDLTLRAARSSTALRERLRGAGGRRAPPAPAADTERSTAATVLDSARPGLDAWSRRSTRRGSRPSRTGCAAARPPASFRRRAVVAVFEGIDAAGKGGAIRRMTAALDAARTTGSSRSPRRPTRSARSPTCGASGATCRGMGQVAIFDRSWYGRVLVERVEGFASAADVDARLRRDQRLRGAAAGAGVVVVKFWLRDQQGGAAAALQGARGDGVQAVQDHRRRTGATARSGTTTRRRSAT